VLSTAEGLFGGIGTGCAIREQTRLQSAKALARPGNRAYGGPMTARAGGWRLFVLATLAVAAIVALTFAARPAGAQAPVADAADRAGDVYKQDVAKAKAKRTARLQKCAKKPTKAKRKACKKGANAAYKQAKQKAATKRDKARAKDKGSDDGPSSPQERREEERDCLRDGGRPSECRDEGRGKP
jgi:hypothetical protein